MKRHLILRVFHNLVYAIMSHYFDIKDKKDFDILYTGTKKFSNISRILIFITEIHVKIYTKLIRFFFTVNANSILFNTKSSCIIARFHLYEAQSLS